MVNKIMIPQKGLRDREFGIVQFLFRYLAININEPQYFINILPQVEPSIHPSCTFLKKASFLIILKGKLLRPVRTSMSFLIVCPFASVSFFSSIYMVGIHFVLLPCFATIRKYVIFGYS